MTSQIIVGDALETLRTLESDSVQCVVTSPPYWGLRDYGEPGQLGLESTPEEHVTAMTAVFKQVRRVLRPDGVLWLNYGDCYAGGGHGGHIDNKAAAGVQGPRYNAPPGLKPKDLVGMPWRIAFALQAAGWWLRHNIVWAKGVSFCPGYSGSVMPESVTDRPTTSHEFVFLLTKSARYYYDADAVREGQSELTLQRFSSGTPRKPGRKGLSADHSVVRASAWDISTGVLPAGRNLRSVWCINPQPFPGSHFATFPEALVAPCILAGTSEYGACAACGKPWERVTEVSYERIGSGTTGGRGRFGAEDNSGFTGKPTLARKDTTTGWEPACACGTEERRPCVVLDPFCGSGTTGLVAARYGRSFVGIELNPEYADMARRRIAPALAQPALLEAG